MLEPLDETEIEMKIKICSLSDEVMGVYSVYCIFLGKGNDFEGESLPKLTIYSTLIISTLKYFHFRGVMRKSCCLGDKSLGVRMGEVRVEW